MPREDEQKRSERTRQDSQWRRSMANVSAKDIRRLVAKLKGEETKK